MTRFAEVNPAALTPAQRKVYDAMIAGPRGAVQGPFHVLLRSPELCARAQALGAFLRFDSALPPRLSELAILVTARFWTAQFEWYMHAPFAAQGGLSADIIEAMRTGGDPRALMQADERAVYDFAVATHERHGVEDAVYAEAHAQLGEAGVVDLVGLLGYYTMISMVLNCYEVPVPGGATPLP
ncbi:MAG: carboxymuconolactone decarboxylase family protein [Proteobacteria bacterium]|nr:carboxymuconolactone decarboxylase family protein [Pseudomonadota bacterium]MDA1058236.1 carboxymuconolactone decarboxylase family protein [Pseudomonadota bacterium]